MKRYFTAILHPNAMHDLLTLKARAEWQAKYRYYRCNRAFMVVIKGRDLTPREIMALELHKGDWTFGTLDSVRYIESPPCAECCGKPYPNKIIRVDNDGACVKCGRQVCRLRGSPVFGIAPTDLPKTARAWLARKLVNIARRLAPRDHGVLADIMEESILDAAKHGTGILKQERIDPRDWGKDFDFLR